MLDHVSLSRLTVLLHDATTSPESDWRIDDMSLEARHLMIGERARPGTLDAKLKLNGAPIAATADLASAPAAPRAGRVKAVVDGFSLRVMRDAQKIDLVALGGRPAASGPAMGSACPPPATEAAPPQTPASPLKRMEELQTRRLEVVRSTLAAAQGIPMDRLVPGQARAAGDAGAEGRVEFVITN